MNNARGDGEAEPIASASLAGQLRRAIARFNQRALCLTQPGSRWLLASVKLGFVIKVAAVSFALVEAFATGTLSHETPRPSRSTVSFAILAVVIAPVIETLQIMLVHLLTRRWIGLAGFVAVSTLLAYALHGPPLAYYPAGAAAAFLIMSYQYVSFRDALGVGKAFTGVAICHAVSNGITALIVAALPG